MLKEYTFPCVACRKIFQIMFTEEKGMKVSETIIKEELNTHVAVDVIF